MPPEAGWRPEADDPCRELSHLRMSWRRRPDSPRKMHAPRPGRPLHAVARGLAGVNLQNGAEGLTRIWRRRVDHPLEGCSSTEIEGRICDLDRGSACAFLVLLRKPLNSNRAQAVMWQEQREGAARQPGLMELVSIPGRADLVYSNSGHGEPENPKPRPPAAPNRFRRQNAHRRALQFARILQELPDERITWSVYPIKLGRLLLADSDCAARYWPSPPLQRTPSL